ncbi:hypothetical protein GCM10027348_01210 [Hymenobacter tenuis]
MVTTWGSSGAEEASGGQTSGAWAHKGPIGLLPGQAPLQQAQQIKGRQGFWSLLGSAVP